MIRKSLLLLTLALFLLSCSPEMGMTATEIPTNTSLRVEEEDNAPVASVTPMVEVIPSSTPAPTPTPTPDISITEVITKDNIGSLTEIYGWGLGSIWGLRELENKRVLVFAGAHLYLYDTEPLTLVATIFDVDDYIVSSDERWIAVSKKDGAVEVWDVATMTLQASWVHAFPENVTSRIEEKTLVKRYVGGMAFSPDGSELAIGYLDGSVDLWKINQETPYASLQSDYFSLGPDDIALPMMIRYSSDGKVLLVAKIGSYFKLSRLTFWDLDTLSVLSLSASGRYLSAITIPETNHDFVVIQDVQSLMVIGFWDAQTGQLRKKLNTNLSQVSLGSLKWDDNGYLTLTGSVTWEEIADPTSNERDVYETYFKQTWDINAEKLISTEEFSPAENDELLEINNELVNSGHFETLWVSGERFFPAEVAALEDGTFRVALEDRWLTLPDGQTEAFDTSAKRPALSVLAEKKALVWCDANQVYLLLDGQEVKSYELSGIPACTKAVLSPQQNYIAAWNHVTLDFINVNTGAINTARFSVFNGRELPSLSIDTIVFSNDEKYFIPTIPGNIRLVEIGPEEITSIDFLQRGIYTGFNPILLFANNSPYFLTLNGSDIFASLDTNKPDNLNKIILWSLFPLQDIRHFVPPTLSFGDAQARLRFTTFTVSPDNQLLVTGDDFGYVRVWDVNTRDELLSLEFDYKPASLVFTKDGAGLVIILSDGTIRLWGIR